MSTSVALAGSAPIDDTPPARPKRRSRRLLIRILLLALAAAIIGAGIFFRPIDLPAAPAFPIAGASVEQGRYLAAIGNCEACHTVPGGTRFAGGVRFETPFGILYSTNITTDVAQGIGGWSFEQFYHAMKHGIGADGQRLYPAFPYTAFAQLSDADIASLYMFMRTVPGATGNLPANEMSFPFNNRGLLYFWQRLYLASETYLADANQSAEWNRGAYLVRGLAHCGACHSPRTMLGAEDNGRFLHGGVYTDRVASGAYRQWSAPDITPGPHGLGSWNVNDIYAYLTTGISARNVVHGPMNEVIASTRQLTPQDARAIAIFLTGTTPSGERWGSSTSGNYADGQIVYTVHCGTCHLPEGHGDSVLGVSLAGNPIVQAPDPSSLINVILYGPDLPPPPFTVNRTRMRSFGRRLSDEDVAAVATYIRNSFGNRASQVTAQQVRRQR